MAVDLDRLKAAILFVASHPSVTALGLTKLYKLLYFADAAHLRETGSAITGSEYIKYQHGPVPSRSEKCVKQLRKAGALEARKTVLAGYAMLAISVPAKPDLSALTAAERATLDGVCRRLGGETAKELSTLSHLEPSWVSASILQKLSHELMMYGAEEDPDGL